MTRDIVLVALAGLLCTGLRPSSSGQESKIPDFSAVARSEIPVAYTWRIEDIYPNVEAWKDDRAAVEVLIARIDALKKDWTSSPGRFISLYQLTDSIGMLLEKLGAYAANQNNVDLGNTTFRGMQGELQSIRAEYGAKLAFRDDDILQMDERLLTGFFVSEPRLSQYRFRVEEVLRARLHVLPKDQQKIVSLTTLFSETSAQVADLLNNVEIPARETTLSDGTRVTLNVAGYMRYRRSPSHADRSLVMRSFWADRKKFENSLAALLDGGIKRDLFTARVEKYNSCLHARLFGDDIDTTVYYQLMATVRNNLAPLHKYLRLRKQMLGLDTLLYDDIYASAVSSVDRSFPYEEARSIVTGSLKPLGTSYDATLANAFEKRWIDIYPNKNKQLGAYSIGVYGVHPFINMNYNGNYEAVSTLAHELGHAVHSYLASGSQTYGNAGYATFLAEIASTLNEHLLMEYILNHETDDLMKLTILDAYLNGVRGTIFRQTLFAEFELAMHRRVEEGKTLTPDWLTEQYLALTRAYYGHDQGVMRVDQYIGNEWSIIPHFFLDFYVFQYSTGMIASLALSEKVLKGTAADVDRYLGMLKAGGSDSPMKLLRNAGVDMTSPEPGQMAMSRFDKLVGDMETLVAKLKSKGKL